MFCPKMPETTAMTACITCSATAGCGGFKLSLWPATVKNAIMWSKQRQLEQGLMYAMFL